MKYSISRSQRKVICRAVSFRSLLGLFPLAAFSSLVPLTVQAQVTPDGTTSTTVNQNGNNFAIEQGDRSGDNLFHSFDEFSVPTLGSAVFNNATDIANIFSRVTGGDISNIDGMLSANGTANLFLINPNGIIFGNNARLDIGGSFYGSTADSLLFDGDVEFSASNPQVAPLLEVSIPIGLSFRDNPGDIVNRSFAPDAVNPGNFARLEVLPGNNITLVGGDINFEAGIAIARGGNIELGSLSQAGVVRINEDGSLGFPEDVAKADISLSNFADLDVQGTGGGNITINAQNLSLESGELGRSLIRAGISSESTSAEAQAGDISINIAENVTLDNSLIVNDVNSGGLGNSGNIKINTSSLNATNGGIVGTFIFGQGNTGDISIVATESVTLNADSTISNLVEAQGNGNAGITNITTNNLNLTDGGRVSSTITGNGNGGNIAVDAKETISINGFGNEGIPSGVFSNVSSQNSVGNAGNIQINTSNLALSNGGVINSVTFGRGDAGVVSISATDTITIDGEAENSFFNSTIASGVANTGIGNSGGIDISTSDLFVTNGGLINTRTDGSGNGGDINLDVQSLSLDDRGVIDASTFANGNSGKVSIKASDIALDNSSFIASEVVGGATGDSNGIEIAATSLNLANGSQIDTNSLGDGDAGAIAINVSDSISLDTASGISNLIGETAIGNSGGVEINTANLSLFNGSLIDTSSLGEGNAGQITINAVEDIAIDGTNSVIFSEVDDNAQGNSEGIQITASNLSLTNGGQINSNSSGSGNSGRILVDVTESIFVDGNNSGILSGVSNTAQANSEGIEINTGNLSLTNGGTIDSQVAGIGNAGNITINATGNILIDGITENEIVSSVFSVISPGAEGNAGNIQINASNLTLSNSGQIDGSTFGKGDSGEINVNTTGDISIDGDRSGIFTTVGEDGLGNAGEGNAGDVEISTVNLSFTNGGQVSSNTSGIGNGGNINISASKSIFVNGLISGIQTSVIEGSQGNAGDIVVDTQNLVLINNGTINASTFGEGNAGKIDINVFESFIAAGNGLTGVISLVGADAQGNAEGIEINSPNIFLLDGGTINTRSFGLGNAGDITVNVDTINIKDNSQIEASNTPSEDLTTNLSGGNINLSILDSLILSDNGDITATASQKANGGNVNINADDGFIIAFPGGDNDITANASQGNGGNININTQAIFGLEERPSTPPNQTNDIDASSEFGLQGDFSLNTPDFDPTTGLIELPAAVGDASDQISQNPCQQGVGSQFIVTGKGGLPPAPTETLNGGGVQVGLVEPLPQPLSYESKGARLRQEEEVQTSKPNSENQISKSVPAMGWVFNDEGEVTLTAYSNKDPESVRSLSNSTTCNANISP